VRIYCLYNEDAIEGDEANESALAFNPTTGDWKMSLPCPAEDLEWVQKSLGAKSARITARDMDLSVEEVGKDSRAEGVAAEAVDMEAFFKL
jgi:hypothetical protein